MRSTHRHHPQNFRQNLHDGHIESDACVRTYVRRIFSAKNLSVLPPYCSRSSRPENREFFQDGPREGAEEEATIPPSSDRNRENRCIPYIVSSSSFGKSLPRVASAKVSS